MFTMQKSEARRRLESVLYVLGAAAGLALSLSGCRGAEASAGAAAPQAPDVSVATVKPTQVHEWDEFNGRVSAIGTVEIRPRVSGYVRRVAYSEGDEVKQGDILFVIDPRPYRDVLDSAVARLARAQATAQLDHLQYTRAQVLMQSSAISHEEFEAHRGEYEQGNADVQAAQAAVATAKLNLSFTEVRAPISGRAGRAVLTPGNLAQADQTLLTTVVSQDPVYVYFDCDEQSYLRFQERVQRRSGVSSANPVRVALANETAFPHVGRIDFLDNELNPSTGTIRARVILPNPDYLFTPGLYARVQLESAGTVQALLVDDKAILTDQDQKYVYVVGSGNAAQRKDVVTGGMADGLRLIQSGLAPGDRVIVSGLQQIYFPGASITPKDVAMASLTQSSTSNLAQE